MVVEEPRMVEGKKADESMVLDPEGGGGGGGRKVGGRWRDGLVLWFRMLN